MSLWDEFVVGLQWTVFLRCFSRLIWNLCHFHLLDGNSEPNLLRRSSILQFKGPPARKFPSACGKQARVPAGRRRAVAAVTAGGIWTRWDPEHFMG